MKLRKSHLLLGFLLLSTGCNALIFGWNFSTAFLTLLSLIVGVHLGLKWLDLRYQNQLTAWLRRLYKIGLFGIGLLCVMILTLVATPQFNCQTFDEAETRKADYMIVLGAGLKNGDEISFNLKSRLDKALEIFEIHPDLVIVVSGGQGADETISEAEAMGRYLVENGIGKNQIIHEDQSRSTHENLLFSQEKLGLLDLSKSTLEQKGIIVSQDFHMFRSGLIAQKLGLDTVGICSPTPLFLKTNYMIREIPAVVNDGLGNILK